MLRFISWCALDIHISIDNCSLLKLHQSQTLQRIFGQQLNNMARTMISNRKLIILDSLRGESNALFRFIKNASILSVPCNFGAVRKHIIFILSLVQIHIKMIMYLILSELKINYCLKFKKLSILHSMTFDLHPYLTKQLPVCRQTKYK